MAKQISIDESLKISFLPDGRAEAEAFVDDRPSTFSSRARVKADETKSPDIVEFCNRWAQKWDEQNHR
jgi:hypothetical protein